METVVSYSVTFEFRGRSVTVTEAGASCYEAFERESHAVGRQTVTTANYRFLQLQRASVVYEVNFEMGRMFVVKGNYQNPRQNLMQS